jgi:hypothetical protein|tara:strand:+ start:349 stop:795 length:447 start_codon:yes stop_codon:yes gene_type:complete
MKTKTETKNKTEIIISTIQHKPYMSEGGSWGNGYLEIPKEHFSYDYVMSYIEDDWGFSGSLCGEEITYDTQTDIGVKIGFDTLHSYNDESHDEKWVLAKCNEIKDYLNSSERLKDVINLMQNRIISYEIAIKETKEKIKQLKTILLCK